MIDRIQKNRDAIAGLCVRYGVTRLELFGSAARGEFVAGKSDVDFFYDINPDPIQGLADRYFAFHEGLESLLGCSVDLISFKDIRNPYFLDSASQHTVLLYAA